MNIQSDTNQDQFTLCSMSDAQLKEIFQAGTEVTHWYSILAKTGDTPITELLRGVERLDSEVEYPEETVQDYETGSQYYFHCHADRPTEYGHFHTYILEAGIPENIKAVKPAVTGEHLDEYRTHCHLVAISSNELGESEYLFTINHWSAQEANYSIEDLVKILNQFDVSHARPSYPVNRLISSILALFKPQIIQLFHDREVAMNAFQAQRPDIPAMANEDLEVTSKVKISIKEQIKLIKNEITKRGLIIT